MNQQNDTPAPRREDIEKRAYETAEAISFKVTMALGGIQAIIAKNFADLGARVSALVEGLSLIEMTAENPADLAPDLIGKANRYELLCERLAGMARLAVDRAGLGAPPREIGDYSCAVCGFGMKEPCEHWKKMLAESNPPAEPLCWCGPEHTLGSNHAFQPERRKGPAERRAHQTIEVGGKFYRPRLSEGDPWHVNERTGPRDRRQPQAGEPKNYFGYLEPEAQGVSARPGKEGSPDVRKAHDELTQAEANEGIYDRAAAPPLVTAEQAREAIKVRLRKAEQERDKAQDEAQENWQSVKKWKSENARLRELLGDADPILGAVVGPNMCHLCRDVKMEHMGDKVVGHRADCPALKLDDLRQRIQQALGGEAGGK